ATGPTTGVHSSDPIHDQCNNLLVYFLILQRQHNPTLFPYTTLFRSGAHLFHQPRGKLLIDPPVDALIEARAIRRQRDHHDRPRRSEEQTSELQSRGHVVCPLLLEKKK